MPSATSYLAQTWYSIQFHLYRHTPPARSQPVGPGTRTGLHREYITVV
jgi:hypothetical protein